MTLSGGRLVSADRSGAETRGPVDNVIKFIRRRSQQQHIYYVIEIFMHGKQTDLNLPEKSV